MFFYHCSISREERGTINFIEKRTKRHKYIRKSVGKGRKELPGERSITAKVG